MNAITAYSANAMPAIITAAPAAATSPIGAAPQVTSSPASRSQTGFDPAPAIAPANGAVQDAVSSKFGPTMGRDFASAAGGGEISDALSNGVSRIAAWAQRGMAGIQQAIQGDMNANNGQVDPARMQQYTMQMSNFEMMNQMAAKIQEKEEAALRAWLR